MGLPNSGVNGVPNQRVSEVYVDMGNGQGSTNTRFQRYSRIVTYTGNDITYTDSSVNGAYFKINTSGVYSMSMGSYNSAFADTIGISVNGDGTVNYINSANSGRRVAINTTVAGQLGGSSGTAYLKAGDTVASHVSTSADGTDDQTFFRIVRVG